MPFDAQLATDFSLQFDLIRVQLRAEAKRNEDIIRFTRDIAAKAANDNCDLASIRALIAEAQCWIDRCDDSGIS